MDSNKFNQGPPSGLYSNSNVGGQHWANQKPPENHFQPKLPVQQQLYQNPLPQQQPLNSRPKQDFGGAQD